MLTNNQAQSDMFMVMWVHLRCSSVYQTLQVWYRTKCLQQENVLQDSRFLKKVKTLIFKQMLNCGKGEGGMGIEPEFGKFCAGKFHMCPMIFWYQEMNRAPWHQ